MPRLKEEYHSLLNIYRSEPYFLEIMPQNIDKAHSLQKLLSSIGLTADEMICCGDGYNDLSMIEYAGLGVAMENAQPVIKEAANFVTRSNDEGRCWTHWGGTRHSCIRSCLQISGVLRACSIKSAKKRAEN